MTRPARARAACWAAIATVTLLVSTACGGDSDPDNASDDPTADETTSASSSVATSDGPTVTASSSPETTPTETPETTSTVPTSPSGPGATSTTSTQPPTSSAGSADGSRPSRARKAQIPAGRLPGLNDQWTWRQASSGPAAGKPSPGVCLQASLVAIGAVTEYRTDFSTSLDELSSATQLTAVFPDEQTAVNSASVLAKWQEKCKQHATRELGHKRVRVTAPTQVQTTVGPAPGWLVSYQPVPDDPRATWFGAEGFVRDGDTLTYLVITTAGQDYNYAPGQQPIELALVEAARKLAATR